MLMARLLPVAAILALKIGAQPAFQAASVRVTPPEKVGYTNPGPFGGNQYNITNADLTFLVSIAYDVAYEQIEGKEKLGSQHYDVTAKAEDGVLLTYEQLKPRLQRLLKDRFRLVARTEIRTFDGYALVAAKGGLKLQTSNGISEFGGVYPGGLLLKNIPVSTFATSLRGTAGRPVVDKTGVTGNYDFELTYAKDGDTDSPLPSFFAALEEKYGLKLEPGKVPLEIVVIDRVEKTPTGN